MCADERAEAYPVELILPNGRAQLVVGSAVDGRPRYLLGGVPIDVDVEIPEDLVARGWFWWGSFLHQQLRPDGCGISIDTGTYPPPGWVGEKTITIKGTDDEGRRFIQHIERGTCFDAARKIEATHARMEAMRQAKPQKPAKKQRPAVPAAPVAIEPEQMVMEL